MKYLKYNSTNIFYTSEGEGDTTLLFLHGWGIDNYYWSNQFTYFRNKYMLYAIDLPGFGRSTSNRTDWTVEEYCNDVVHFIDNLRLKKVILIGHSMSGDIMLETALKGNPAIIGLIGIDNFKTIDVQFSQELMKEMNSFFELMQKDFKTYAPAYAERVLFHPSTDSIVREKVKNDFARLDPKVGMSSLIDVMKYAEQEPEKLSLLNLKLNLVNSDASPTNIEGLKKHCKSFELFEIHETGHYPMIEKPAEFNRQLQKVINNLH